MGFSSGSILLFSANLFVKPITADLGFGRGTLSTAIGFHFVLSAIATPIFGHLIDRYGVRPMMLPSIKAPVPRIDRLAIPHTQREVSACR